MSHKSIAHNRKTITDDLTKRGALFTIHNNGAHLRVKTPQGVVNFWPGTDHGSRQDGSKIKCYQELLEDLGQKDAEMYDDMSDDELLDIIHSCVETLKSRINI